MNSFWLKSKKISVAMNYENFRSHFGSSLRNSRSLRNSPCQIGQIGDAAKFAKLKIGFMAVADVSRNGTTVLVNPCQSSSSSLSLLLVKPLI